RDELDPRLLARVSEGLTPSMGRDDGTVLGQIRSAYAELRLSHQNNFFSKRTSVYAGDFAGISSIRWRGLIRLFLGLALASGLIASVLSIFRSHPIESLPVLVASCTVFGVALRSWSEGMRFEQELEHYDLMRRAFGPLLGKWQEPSCLDRSDAST